MISPQDPRYQDYVRLRALLFDKQRRDKSSGRKYSEEEIDQEIAATIARLNRKRQGNGSAAPGDIRPPPPGDGSDGYGVGEDEPQPGGIEPNGSKGIGQGPKRPRENPGGKTGQVDRKNAKGVTLTDFYAFMPMHSYIFAPTGDMWPAASVNARIASIPLLDQNGKPITEDGKPKKMLPSAWLDRHKPTEQMTWAPGEPMLIRDRLISDGGWIARDGVTTFNLYRPPMLKHGNAADAGPWLNHVRKIYGTDADHIICWLAHRVQRPHEKINHALVLGGSQGVGKDTLLEAIKYAVGPWNFCEVSPQHLLARFNGFLKSVILRVSEARDLGDVDRFKFYDHSKAFTAAPPDVLRVDEKHLREYVVLNVTGVIITSNHKTDGIYLPADDRRHYVAWTDLTRDDFKPGYWNTLWRWYANGGIGHVAAYLAAFNLNSFDPKAPPPKTSAFWDIVQAGQTPEDAELADVLDNLGNPPAVTIGRIASQASGEFAPWLRDRKNRRLIPHRLEKCGYLPVRNEAAADGLWKMHEARQVIYAKSELSVRERFVAAQKLWEASR